MNESPRTVLHVEDGLADRTKLRLISAMRADPLLAARLVVGIGEAAATAAG